MKLLFVHDHPFFVDEQNNIYSGGGLPKVVWDNYLCFFSSIVVFGRYSINEKNKKVLSSGDCRCTFVLTKNFSSTKSLFIQYGLLKKEIKKEIQDADIVLVRLPSTLGFVAAQIAKYEKKKIIVEQVGNAKEALFTHGSFLGKIAAPIFHSINKKITANADYVVYVTRHKLQKNYPAPKALIASISDVFIPNIISANHLNRKKFTNKILKIGLIGGFDARYKGQDILLKAVNYLPEVIKKDIELYFIGKGNYDWVLEISKQLGLENNIKYIGPKEAGIEIFDFLEDMSIYAQPSRTEGMPRSLLEAMSRGCPVIGSNVGGISDVVDPIFIHKSGDYLTLSKHIKLLYYDRDLLCKQAIRSIYEIQPYLKSRLDQKRKNFFSQIINNGSLT